MKNKEELSKHYVLPVQLGEIDHLVAGYHEKKWRTHRYQTNDKYSISLILKGQGWFSLDGGPRQMIKGGMSFINFDQHHYHFGPDPSHPWEEYFVVFKGPLVDRWKALGVWKDEEGPKSLPHPLRLRDLFIKLFACEDIQSDYCAVNVIHRLESLVLERAMQLEGHSHEYSSMVQDLREQCWEDPTKDIDFSTSAMNHDVSYSHLRKTFTKEVGMAPKQFMLKVRFTKAQQYLINRDLSITQVAELMGYRDVYSFSRSYKSAMGESPTDFRNGSSPHPYP